MHGVRASVPAIADSRCLLLAQEAPPPLSPYHRLGTSSTHAAFSSLTRTASLNAGANDQVPHQLLGVQTVGFLNARNELKCAIR